MAGQTVVVSVLADTKKFSKAFKGLSKDSGLTSLAKGLGSLASTAVKTVAGIGAAIGGLAIGGGIARAMNIDEAKTKLEALGYTGKDLDTIMGNALNSVKGTAFGLDAAATTAAQALAAGVKPGKDLEAQLTTVANTAALAGVDMNEMGSIFGKVWANGKVTTEEMNQLADRGVPIWQTLSEAFGVSNEELRKMISGGEVTADMFTGALGPAVEGMAGKMGSSFKGMAANAMAALSRLGAMFMGPLLDAAKPWLGWLTENIDKVAEQLTPFARKFEAFLAKLSPDKVIPLVKEFLNFGKGLKDIASPLGNITSLADKFAPVLGAIGGALAPLMKHLPIIGKFLPAIGGPLGVVIGLLGGMVAGSEDLQGALGQFVKTLAPVVMQIFEALAPVVATVAEVLATVANTVAELLVPVIEALTPVLQLVGDVLAMLAPIITALVAAIGGLVQALAPVVQIILEALVPVIESLMKVLRGVIDFIVGVFTGNWEQAWDGIKGILSGVMEAIGNIIKGALDVVLGLFGTSTDEIIENVSQWTKEAGDNIRNFAEDTGKNISNWVSDVGTNIGNFAKDTGKNIQTWSVEAERNILNGWDAAKTGVSRAWNGIKSGIGSAASATLNTVRGWMSNVSRGISNGWNSVVSFFRSMPGRIRSAIGSAGTMLLNIGRNIITGLANGIRNGASAVISAITNTIQSAIDWGKNLLGIRSPSRVFRDIGQFTVKGLEQGLSGRNNIRGLMGDLAGQVENGFDPSLSLSSSSQRRGSGREINITVQTGVGDPVEIGRQVANYIRSYERAGGVFA